MNESRAQEGYLVQIKETIETREKYGVPEQGVHTIVHMKGMTKVGEVEEQRGL